MNIEISEPINEEESGEEMEDVGENDIKDTPNDDEIHEMHNLTEEDVCAHTFETKEEAYNFYNLYAQVHGFSIRKCTTKKHNEHEVVAWLFRCSRASICRTKYTKMENRRRQHRPLTRCDCKAILQIKFDVRRGSFIVTSFVKQHNHGLAGPHEVSLLRSYQHVDEGHRNQALAMQSCGIGINQIIDEFSDEVGGYQNVGFTRRDLYNVVDRDKRAQIAEGDTNVAFTYLQGLADSDPGYFYRYTIDDENRLEKLFWTDGRSREEFKLFGDVLVFDATYKTNRYKFPLIILAGSTNHRTTCIFGTTIVKNESTESYVWVLNKFVEAMDNKRPVSVVTDGNRSMHAVVELVLSNSRHRLCKWHLQQNARTNVKIKNFNGIFNHYMSLNCSINEFEQLWRNMVATYRLQDNRWINDVYEKRHMWAESYLRGHFFGGIKSTQRCEGKNAFMSYYLESGSKLIDFVRDYHKGLLRIRLKSVEEEVKTNHTSPVLTTELRELERQASTSFTRSIFFEIQNQIKLQARLWHVQRTDNGKGIVSYILANQTNDSVFWQVNFYQTTTVVTCECLMFESNGIPCSHVIYMLKCERVNEFPASCIKL